MTKESYAPFDVAAELKTEAAMRGYLDACLEDGSPRLIEAALADIARARAEQGSGCDLRKP